MVNVRICVLALFLVTLLSQTLSGVSALGTTTITNLIYPSGDVAAVSAAVTFDLTYSGLNSSQALVAAILNSTTKNFAAGTASSTPDQCISTATTQYSGDALCVWRLGSSSGTEHVSFDLQFPGTHIQSYDFAAVSTILTTAGTLLGVSQEAFSITGGTTFELTVNTAYPVAVTIDGSTAGSSPLELTPGSHVISVPTVVQIDNSSRLRFDHWDDGSTQPNRTLNIQSDTTIAATFVPQYLLTLNSPPVNATGAGWYDEDSSAQFSVPSSPPMPGLLGDIGAKMIFKGWYENGNLFTTADTGTTNMFESHTLHAQWVPDYTLPAAISSAVAAIALASGALLTRRRMTRGKRKKNTRARKTRKKANRRRTRSDRTRVF